MRSWPSSPIPRIPILLASLLLLGSCGSDDGHFQITGLVLSEPVQSAGPFRIGPRVLLDGEAYSRADLEQRGSMAVNRLLIKLADSTGAEGAEQLATELTELVGEYDGIRVRTY